MAIEDPAGKISFRTLYEAAGGHPTFQRLVDTFYAKVAEDPILRPLYPEPNLSGASERLRLFLEQYWGGPTTYTERRGHPRLRLRHQRFSIGTEEREHWLRNMVEAVESLDLDPKLRSAMIRYFESSSAAMINQPGEEPGPQT